MTGHSAQASLDARIDMMTKAAQEAINKSQEHASQLEDIRFSLHKISTTQDSIAEKFGDGKMKMQDHENRLRALEAIKAENHETRLQSLEMNGHTVEGFFKALRLLGQAAWAVVAFGGLGLLGLVGYLLKYYGH